MLRNIDISYTGLYRFAVYVLELESVRLTGDLHSPGAMFTSPGYFIEYGDDFKLVNQFVSFEVTMNSTQLASGVHLGFELQFATAEESRVRSGDYRVICSSQVVISRLQQGVLEYFPVLFGGLNYCTLNLNVLAFVGGFDCSSVEEFTKKVFTDCKGNVKRMIGGVEIDTVYASYCGVLQATYKALWGYLAEVCQHPILHHLETTSNRSKQFSQRIGTHDPRLIAEELLSDMEMWTWHIAVLKTHLIEGIREEEVTLQLREIYLRSMQERAKSSFIKTVVTCSDFPIKADSLEKSLRLSTAKAVRQLKLKGAGVNYTSVTQEGYLPAPGLGAVIYETEYERQETLQATLEGIREAGEPELIHVVIFVHGYRGTVSDMQFLIKPLAAIQPNLILYSARSNEGGSDSSIIEQGYRLASEVLSFLNTYHLTDCLDRLSFIGYSMGGLVIRAAMPALRCLSGKMHVLLTISTPHLGFVDCSSKMLGAGMWLINQVKSYPALRQIAMNDASTLHETCLYSLSQYPGLGWFSHVVLIGSSQDSYVPVESALVQVPAPASNKPNGLVYTSMAQELLSSVKHLTRLDVIFSAPKKFLDKMIGRAAHIECLESDELIRLLSHYYAHLFK
jgi:hypothetical protein